jgi:hypothetical protein
MEIIIPHSRRGVCLCATGKGVADVERFIALEMTSAPIAEDILSQFETGVFSALESAVAEMVGIQPLLLV